MTILMKMFYVSNNKEAYANSLVSLVNNSLWKNAKTVTFSTLYVIFESTVQDEYLDVHSKIIFA